MESDIPAVDADSDVSLEAIRVICRVRATESQSQHVKSCVAVGEDKVIISLTQRH